MSKVFVLSFRSLDSEIILRLGLEKWFLFLFCRGFEDMVGFGVGVGYLLGWFLSIEFCWVIKVVIVII